MTAIALIPIDEAGLQEYTTWFEDTELRRRVDAPTRHWFEYVRDTPGVYAWLAQTEDAATIGFVQLDIDPTQAASMALVVKPNLRHQGYGQAILRALLARPELAGVRAIEAGIAADNTASLRCFAAAGFVPASDMPDADGFLKLMYRPQLG